MITLPKSKIGLKLTFESMGKDMRRGLSNLIVYLSITVNHVQKGVCVKALRMVKDDAFD